MKRVIGIWLLLLVCLGLDQATKWQAVKWLKGQASHSYFDHFFILTYAENSGAMLSLGGQMSDSWRFYVFTVSVALMLLVALFYLFSRPLPLLATVSGTLIISGGLGNLYDRMVNDGRVIDFMNMGIGSLRTGIFNVADIVIMVGALGLTVWALQADSPEGES